jgi:hypothetical protein
MASANPNLTGKARAESGGYVSVGLHGYQPRDPSLFSPRKQVAGMYLCSLEWMILLSRLRNEQHQQKDGEYVEGTIDEIWKPNVNRTGFYQVVIYNEACDWMIFSCCSPQEILKQKCVSWVRPAAAGINLRSIQMAVGCSHSH